MQDPRILCDECGMNGRSFEDMLAMGWSGVGGNYTFCNICLSKTTISHLVEREKYRSREFRRNVNNNGKVPNRDNLLPSL